MKKMTKKTIAPPSVSPLADRRILLIISGGIAAYKSLELIRRLKEQGAEVRCILTEGGARFVTPLSVAALTGQAPRMNLFDPQGEEHFGHIALARWADLILVAPASANMLAKMAHGLADSLASAVLLAAAATPVVVAPAMNAAMWAHPATQMNLKTLIERGMTSLDPESGALACGEEGAGRMREVATILEYLKSFFRAQRALSGVRVLVTSGPTHEPIDPVRFIGNRSSGKQGHAIAAALSAAGADVTLVTGPVSLPAPAGVRTVPVETAQQMLTACLAALPCTVAICAAAVADWRPETRALSKLKKQTGQTTPSLSLVENPDILALLSKKGPRRPRLMIGFAAETDLVLKNARAKFARKGCDWLLANKVGAGIGFGMEDNQVTLLRRTSPHHVVAEPWPTGPKSAVAQKLVQAISHALNAQQPIDK